LAGYLVPSTAHNARAVTPREYEDLMNPMAPDGVLGLPSDPALVYADGTLLGFKVRANQAALIRGHRWESGTTEVQVNVSANNSAGTTRKDLAVLRLTRNPWDASIQVVAGTASATPVTPSPTYGTDTSTGVWELPLAEITVPYNATNVGPSQCVPLAWYVGDDGQIVCTSTTRPPHQAGRAIYETDTGKRLLSDGTAWRTVSEDTGWVNFSTASGWVSRTTRVRRVNGWVQLHCDVARAGTTLAADTASTIATLPDGFRPAVTFTAVGLPVSSSGQVSRVAIQTSGVVRVVTGPGFGATSWLDCWASWPIG
jgi:hypothetical protein